MPQCVTPQAAGLPQFDQEECYCRATTCGAGMLDSGAAVLATRQAVFPNYSGLFWNAPAGSESGWGINIAHQGDIIFATWFTYDLAGKAWWLSMTAPKTGPSTFAGTLYQTHGPAFSATPFKPTDVSAIAVGAGTLTFRDGDNGTFAYTVNGITQSKSITRQVFGSASTCVWGLQANLAIASVFQPVEVDSSALSACAPH